MCCFVGLNFTLNLHATYIPNNKRKSVRILSIYFKCSKIERYV